MTKFYLIRHGKTDYVSCDKRSFIGHGRDLAPLTDLGIKQIQEASIDPRLKNAELIVSSPYTRALHSAALLNRELNIDIQVNIDLHEWLPDITFQYESTEKGLDYFNDFNLNNGRHPSSLKKNWEELSTLRKRVKNAIEKYKKYKFVIIVCHGMVIRSLKYKDLIKNGEIIEYDYPEDEENEKWVFKQF